ncbi:hypothetical protein [Proteus mirabilis]|uniref:hypothetical protein n=1 Tax=Proteus mirabilis TaxID=584 RepID=UPI00235F66C8|nr:hypothetical protein [Proteus mirabilis]MDC9769036.1 hypothetical protein [Proteus mirabilis]
MYWKIPNIPDKKIPVPPKYKKIILSYIIFISLIYLYITKFIDKEKIELVIYLLCIISVIFLIIIGFIFIRYQREIIIVDNWNEEKK